MSEHIAGKLEFHSRRRAHLPCSIGQYSSSGECITSTCWDTVHYVRRWTAVKTKGKAVDGSERQEYRQRRPSNAGCLQPLGHSRLEPAGRLDCGGGLGDSSGGGGVGGRRPDALVHKKRQRLIYERQSKSNRGSVFVSVQQQEARGIVLCLT